MTENCNFYIFLPNSDCESWGRWVWSDAEERAFVSLRNTNVSSSFLINLKKIHFSNTINKKFWIPLKTIWDHTYPIKINMIDPNANNFIIFHSGVKFSPYFLRKIKQNRKCKIILYLPDTLTKLKIANNEKEWYRYQDHYLIDYVFSFDPEDCKRYGFVYFDVYSITNKISIDTKPTKNLFYIGNCRNNQRLNLLKEIYNRVNRSINCDFRIAGVPLSKVIHNDGLIYNQPMPYSEVVKQIQRSTCILELVNTGQHGNTLRFKEAVCYNRKLITNNPEVLNSKYYNPCWIQYFKNIEDIDISWIVDNDIPSFQYDGSFSPLNLLKMIENIK